MKISSLVAVTIWSVLILPTVQAATHTLSQSEEELFLFIAEHPQEQ